MNAGNGRKKGKLQVKSEFYLKKDGNVLSNIIIKIQ